MKTKKSTELRKIKNGQLFRSALTDYLYVRDDYSSRCSCIKCHRFDSVEAQVMLPADTLVYRASIAEFH